MFEIEKNVPLPKLARNPIYPFAQMAVGDSFFVPGGNATHIRNYASRARREGFGNFSVRVTDGETPGFRVWRVA